MRNQVIDSKTMVMLSSDTILSEKRILKKRAGQGMKRDEAKNAGQDV